MRSAKQYSNATFTKRVDHEAGRHRGVRAPAEPAVCRECGALYANRRWVAPGATSAADLEQRYGQPVRATLCSACKQARGGAPAGFVHLAGEFLRVHLDEARHLVENEARKAATDNPLARILTWTEEGPGEVTVTTTTEHLAQRLGDALHAAYRGEVRYDFSHENKLARVYWRRD